MSVLEKTICSLEQLKVNPVIHLLIIVTALVTL